MTGFVCVNKKPGDTSAYCVNKIKRKLGLKCGHMGTLDPLASGVLPVAIGQATRLFKYLLDKEKVYLADFDFAYSTPSFDLETKPDFFSERIPANEEIESVLPDLIGEVMQIPPCFSAKLVDGKRSYKLARKGITSELPPKKVIIYSIDVEEKLSDSSYRFRIKCGGGTYIRSIVRDISNKLGCYGVMTKLVRLKSGAFDLENSYTIEELMSKKDFTQVLIKPEDVLDFPVINLEPLSAKRLLDGLTDVFSYENGTYKVFSGNGFLGVGEVNDGILKMQAYVRDM